MVYTDIYIMVIFGVAHYVIGPTNDGNNYQLSKPQLLEARVIE